MEEDRRCCVTPFRKTALCKGLTLMGMATFSVGYMLFGPNLDGFNLEEGYEAVTGKNVTSFALHISGFTLSFLANVPALAAILYSWHRDAKTHEAHHHSRFQLLLEFVCIGVPFALMGCAAFLEAAKQVLQAKHLTAWQLSLIYLGSAISAFFTAWGAFKLHSVHVHDAMAENGGGLKGFGVGLYRTFIKNVWLAHEAHDTCLGKCMAVLHDAWMKSGIVLVHGLLGGFASSVFLEETGLKGWIPALDALFIGALSVVVMLYEGNTEARSLDTYKTREREAYLLYSKLSVTLSGVFHSVPIIVACLMLTGDHGLQLNTAIALFASIVFGYPSVYGFAATTVSGFDLATKQMRNGAKSVLGKACCFYPAIAPSEEIVLIEQGNAYPIALDVT